MKATSQTYKDILAAGTARKFLCKIYVTLADDTQFTLTNDDIWEDSFKIDTAVSGTSSFDIGSAIIGKCTFTINNIEGDYDDYDFFNADATVWVGLDGDKTNNTQNYYRMGFFTVDEPQVANGLITLELLDNMWKFDVPFSDVNMTFTLTTTARTVVSNICSHCGVTLSTQTFNGFDIYIPEPPEDKDEMNCREMLQYVAMLGCNFCVINDNGALEIKWYNSTSDIFDRSMDTKCGTDSITITGVKFVINDTEYSRGYSEYVLELENPLVNEDNITEILDDYIWTNDRLKYFTFRTFNITTLADLSAEVGDRIRFKDYKGDNKYSYITNNSFAFSNHSIQCNAVSPQRTLVKRYSKEVKTAVKVARQQAEELISSYDLSVQELNKLVNQSMGAFADYEDAPNGGRIYYISNMPITKDEYGVCHFQPNSIVWRMAGDVLSISTNGGQTWQNGYNPSTGELIVNVLSAIGIQADWIKTGTLTVGGSTSGTQHPVIEVKDTNNSTICTIDRSGITMHQGIISSPDYAEASGATFSTTGMKIDVLNKILRSPYFAIEANGAYFKGEILITGDIENVGSGTFNLFPSQYGLVDDFELQMSAPVGYTSSATYEISKVDGSLITVVASGTIDENNPIAIVILNSLIATPSAYYKVEISDNSIRVNINKAVKAQVDDEGFQGDLTGKFTGSVYSDIGEIGSVRYGESDNKRLMSGVFEYPDTINHNNVYLDFPNSRFFIGQYEGGTASNIKASVSLDEDGMINLLADGDYGDVVRIVSNSRDCDITFREDVHGGNIRRSWSEQGIWVDEPVMWNDGSWVSYNDIQKSTSDSPPQYLADGHLFLVYEN